MRARAPAAAAAAGARDSSFGHLAEWFLPGGVRVVSTGWAQGDLSGDGPLVERRRKAVVDLPWTILRQVHGARVVVVDRPGGACGEAADAAVSIVEGTALAVLTADCAPVALASPDGVFGLVHAGWRGLRAGVVEAAVQSMRRLGATKVDAVIGPCIHPCCYPFGTEELLDIERRYGAGVRAADRDGAPALDLPAGVGAALHAAGAGLVGTAGLCTACSSAGLWSWRAQRASRRQATVAWRP